MVNSMSDLSRAVVLWYGERASSVTEYTLVSVSLVMTGESGVVASAVEDAVVTSCRLT